MDEKTTDGFAAELKTWKMLFVSHSSENNAAATCFILEPWSEPLHILNSGEGGKMSPSPQVAGKKPKHKSYETFELV